MKPYERLAAWERSHHLALAVYRVVEQWPAAARFGVSAHGGRAAVSVPTGFAEGCAQRGQAEFRRFIDISVGSLARVSFLLRFARDLGIISSDVWAMLDAL